MRDSELLALSLIISLVGLGGLAVSYSMVTPEELSIEELGSKQEGEMVVVGGKVEEIENHQEGHVFMTLRDDTGRVTVPVFSQETEKLGRECKEGAFARVEGRVKTYRGSLEVLPEGAVECWNY